VAFERGRDIHFFVLLIIFAVIYFGICLPVFQIISKWQRGRKFIIRLGGPWSLRNVDHRWDVLMSFISFAVALGLSLYCLDLLYPLELSTKE